MKFPREARPGDPVRVVAPSGPFELPLFERGLSALSIYDLRLEPEVRERRHGYFAGTDAQRLSELQTALDDPDARAVFVARGGYGMARLLPHLDWSGFQRNPKWLVGFSDTTCLHSALQKLNYASIHGPHVTGLHEEGVVRELRDMLAGKGQSTHQGLTSVVPGVARGVLAGGNLTVLFCEAASGRLKFPRGALIVLEDVTETSYRVDRMLTALADGGHFKLAGGVIFGEFTDCSPGRFGVDVRDVLCERAREWNLPVASGLPVGHGTLNAPLVFGAEACLDSAAGTLSIPED